jgi:hypothetical protein
MKSLRSYFVGWLLLSTVALAAVPERELGSGLFYVRVKALPADLPPQAGPRAAPTVLDLRYVRAEAEAAATFADWLKQRATPRTPVFVLANSETAPPLLKVLAGHERGTGIVVVGIAGTDFRPDVPVKASAAEERRAYDALEKGAVLAALLADNPTKVRNDEASLTRERPAEPPADPAAAKRETPPIDLTLQRAVHLHRALVALKKI